MGLLGILKKNIVIVTINIISDKIIKMISLEMGGGRKGEGRIWVRKGGKRRR